MKELSIDLETYSDVDIKKSGVYRYAESDNFEILLFAVSIDSGKGLSTSFCIPYDPAYQEHIQKDDRCRAGESPLLSDSTEDEVGTLLWHESICSLCSVQISLTKKAAWSNGNLWLIYIVTDTGGVVFKAKQNLNTRTLVPLKHIVEDEVCRENQDYSSDKCDSG